MGCIGAAITVVELVEGPDRLPAGRALDPGAGRNALYLAAHDWDTIGVEMAGYAVELATRAATAKALPARFLQGDVTRLAELAIGGDFTLLMDGGCYHMIPANRRDAYAESVTTVAASGCPTDHGRVQSPAGHRHAARRVDLATARLAARALDPVPARRCATTSRVPPAARSVEARGVPSAAVRARTGTR